MAFLLQSIHFIQLFCKEVMRGYQGISVSRFLKFLKNKKTGGKK